MSLPIYQRVAVTDAGDVIPGAEYTVINENTGVAAPIYSDRTGATLLSAPYFADSAGTIQFFIAQGTTFRVAASGGVGTYTDRYVYGVAEAVLVQADGNVGIGTNSPNGRLGVTGGTTNASTLLTAYNNAAVTIVPKSNSGYSLAIGSGPSDFPYLQMSASGTGANALNLNPYGGNVGIGTSSPAAGMKLHVQGVLGTADGTASDPAHTFYGDTDTGMFTVSSDTLGLSTAGSERLRIASDGDLYVGCTAIPTGGASTGLSISNNSGKQMVTHGVAGTANTYVNVYKNANGIVGGIRVNGSATAYDTSSDYRLKEDDVPMTGATERVKALRPINFAWKVDGSRTDGFFAHEVQKVVPESAGGSKDAMRDEEYEVTPAVYKDVTTPAVEAVLDEDGMVITEAVEESTESVLVTEAVMATRSVPDYQGIDQSKLVPLLTATIQELIARIEALESGA